MNDLSDIKEIWTNSYVVSFLSLIDDDKFAAIIKESEIKKELDEL